MGRIKVFTSFSGVGSQEMALRNIGIDFEVVGTCEVDKTAIIAYDSIHNDSNQIEEISKKEMVEYFKRINIGYNFSTFKSEIPKNEDDIRRLYESSKRNKNYGDIRLLDPETLPDFDLFTYSFPCKNISVAGRREGFKKDSDTQSSLLWEVEKIIKTKNPKYLMLENVKNIVGNANINEFNSWLDILNSCGYNTYWEILNGLNFDVPQNRERVIAISIRKDIDDGSYKLPKGKRTTITLRDFLEEGVDEKFYINKPFTLTVKNNKAIAYEKYKLINKNEFTSEFYIDDMNFKLPNQNISYCIDASYYKGTNIKSYIEKCRRQLVNDPKTGLIRKLTPLECWRVMGFKDEDFHKAKNTGISNTKLYERAGRGIVVPMLEHIFNNLFETDHCKLNNLKCSLIDEGI